jgi:ketosteroid isomerase-like protein
MSPLHLGETIAEGGVVTAIGVERGTLVRATGKRYNMPFVHVIGFKVHGKVTHVREYDDSRELLPAFAVDQ